MRKLFFTLSQILTVQKLCSTLMSKSAVLKMWSAGPTTVLTVNTLFVINVFAFFAVWTFAKVVVRPPLMPPRT